VFRLLVTLMALSLTHGAAVAAPELSARTRLVLNGLWPAARVGGTASRGAFTVRLPGLTPPAGAPGRWQALTPHVWSLAADEAELRALVAMLPNQARVEEQGILRPTLDKAAAAIGAPAARQRFAVDGTGVLVAVVDTGLDLHHADFRNADGTTRVAVFYDVSGSGADHPELPVPYGGVWRKADIDAALVAEAAGQPAAGPLLSLDANGHGTHVAGIAASNGLGTGHGLPGGRYVGIAPGAELIAVKATRSLDTFRDIDVISGCKLARDVGVLLGRPVVVNLSVGGPIGPRDGHSNLEEALDEIFTASAPGLVAVTSAGNDGILDQHAGGYAVGRPIRLPLKNPGSGTAPGSIVVELWYRGTLSVGVDSPGGLHLLPIPAGASLVGPLAPEGRATVDNTQTAPNAQGLSSSVVVLDGIDGTHSASGVWTLVIEGATSRWDAYIVGTPASAVVPRFTDYIAPDGRLAAPATARNLISVASLVSRDSWINPDGTLIKMAVSVGTPSLFSSPGPTSDGRFAPDVIAPGEYVLSSLSIDAPPDKTSSAFYVANNPTLALADDGVHGALRGTSQASPMVAGSVALLLAARPTLTSDAVRELLRATAKPLPGPGWSPRAGFGVIDTVAALTAATTTLSGTVDSQASTVAVSRDWVPPSDEQVRISIVPRDPTGLAIGPGHAVTVAVTHGRLEGRVVDRGQGRYEQLVTADAPLGAVGVITVTVDGITLAAQPSIFYVIDRSQIGAPFVASGGCDASRAAPTPLLAIAILLIALVIRRRHPKTTMGNCRQPPAADPSQSPNA